MARKSCFKTGFPDARELQKGDAIGYFMEGAPLSGAELRPDMDKDCSVLFILVDSWKPQLREWDPIEIPQKTGTLEFNIVIKFTDRQQGEARYIPNLSGGVNPGPGPGPGPEDSENTSVRGVDSLTSTAKSGIITVHKTNPLRSYYPTTGGFSQCPFLGVLFN